jgi:hypothetical protein
MEALILAIIIAYAVKKAAESAHEHWQSSKGANRKASKGKPVGQRAKSAARHDAAYWAEQVRGGFPQVRHGLYMGWNAGRVAQLEGREARAKARADHAHLRARVTEAVRGQRRRQEEALERIRAAARQSAGPEPRWCGTCLRALPDGHDGTVCPRCQARNRKPPPGEPREQPGEDTGSTPAAPPSTEGNTMSGDTTYTQQMAELEAIRRDADEEVSSVRRKRMMNRLDVLMSLGLDKDTLSEAAEIDDALREQEKAAQQTLDASDAAISGLKQRHGGIKAATDDAPVDKPADPDFYVD